MDLFGTRLPNRPEGTELAQVNEASLPAKASHIGTAPSDINSGDTYNTDDPVLQSMITINLYLNSPNKPDNPNDLDGFTGGAVRFMRDLSDPDATLSCDGESDWFTLHAQAGRALVSLFSLSLSSCYDSVGYLGSKLIRDWCSSISCCLTESLTPLSTNLFLFFVCLFIYFTCKPTLSDESSSFSTLSSYGLRHSYMLYIVRCHWLGVPAGPTTGLPALRRECAQRTQRHSACGRDLRLHKQPSLSYTQSRQGTCSGAVQLLSRAAPLSIAGAIARRGPRSGHVKRVQNVATNSLLTSPAPCVGESREG